MMKITLSPLLFVATHASYPQSYTSCGVKYSVSKTPERVITMNQGATELMLALGLADKMAGTAYLDDHIWPQYAAAYGKIPVLSTGYPNETTIMSKNPDFIVASYNSAFREQYDDKGKKKGIFSAASVGPCKGTGSEFAGVKTTCRPQLHAKNIGTYLFADACEDKTLRPTAVTENIVYDEMRALGKIFNVDVEKKIKDMKADFDSAAAMVSSSSHGKKLKAVWLDCVGCCKTADGVEKQIFVGAASGAPGLLMKEAGLDNAFAGKTGNWVCVKESELVAAAPDVIVVVDASWDTALSKITWMYNHTDFCKMDALQGARFVQIPFSASTLGPRNGPASLDLAIASLHVRLGTTTEVRESGVKSFKRKEFESHIAGLKCVLDKDKVKYDAVTKLTSSAQRMSTYSISFGTFISILVRAIIGSTNM